jgi:hypothetical protein
MTVLSCTARAGLFAVLAPILAGGCDRGTDRPDAETRPVAAACVSRPEGSRWAGAYRAAAVFGDSEAEEMGGVVLAGIAATDSMVYVMESGRAVLWMLRPDLSLVRRVGREGRGPGEWLPFGPVNQGGSMRWVHASATGVRLFEGERIQEFSPAGRFRRVMVNGALQAGISPLQSRLAFVGDTLLYSAGGYDIMASVARGGKDAAPRRDDPVGGRSLWWVRMRAGEEDRAVLQLGLTPLERRQGVGPAQALPLWDANGACVAASDGAEPLLVYAPLAGGAQDTVAVPLPDRAARAEDYAERMNGVLKPGMEIPRPSAAARVRDLVLDPDGFVWLLPVQPAQGIPGGVEVVRVPLDGGRAVLDTVPAFPRVFGEPGVYFAETYSPDGAIHVVRYQRAGAVAVSVAADTLAAEPQPQE